MSTDVSTSPDVRLVGVTKRFEDVVAVDDLSLDMESGSFFALLGPSGCGKTTTLRMIGGFEQPTEGQIYLGEREVSGLPAYKRDVNTVFQSSACGGAPFAARRSGAASARSCASWGSRGWRSENRASSRAGSNSGSRWPARS